MKYLVFKFINIIRNMHIELKTTSLLILGATAIALSRVMFLFFDDPEGPNLLVVMVIAVVLYVLSLTLCLSDFFKKHFFSLLDTDFKKLLFVILLQTIIITTLYFCLG